MSPREDQEFAEIAAQAAWVRRLALALSRDAALGEDVAQDALLSALDRQPHSIEDLRAWLRTVVQNLTRFRHRSDAHRTEREARAARPERQEDPALAHERLEIQAQLLNAVQELDEPYRTAVLLRWFEELTPHAIAERTGVPVRTVHIRISRALRLLRETLDRRSRGDRSKWMAAWIPLLPKPSSSWPELLVMTAKTKLALATLVLVCGVTALVVLMPRDTSVEGQTPAVALGHETVAVPSGTSTLVDEEPRAEATRAAAVEAAPVTTPKTADPKLRKITGLVVDTSGARLRDIGVVLHESGAGHASQGPSCLSDANGRFELETSCERGVLGPADESWMLVYEPSLQVPDPMEGYVLVIAHPIQLRGRVVDVEKRPIPNAEIVFAPLGGSGSEFEIAWTDPLRATLGLPMDASKLRHWNTKTGKLGEFKLDVPPLIDGMVLSAAAPTFNSSARVPNGLGEDYLFVLHLVNEPHAGRLSGRVVGPQGEAITRARVFLGSAHAGSDEQGEFVLRIDEKSPARRLVAYAEGWMPAVQDCLATAPSDSGAWPSPLVLTLHEPALSIQGVVVDVHGQPIPKVEVKVLDPVTWNELFASVSESMIDVHGGRDSAMHGTVSTNKQGRFEVSALLPRDYRLRIADRSTLAMTISGPIAAGTKDVSIVLGASDRRCAVAGQVLDLRGKPIVGALVRARRSIPSPTQSSASESIETESVHTDEQGRFVFGEMSCDVMELAIQPETAGPGTNCPIQSGQDRSALVVSVPRIGHVRIEVQRPDLVADSVSFLDARGVRLQVGARRGDSGWISGESLPVTNGRTEAMVVSELATTVVLLKDGNEVARTTVQIVPGEMVVVRP